MSTDWSCTACTLINTDAATFCAVCGTSRSLGSAAVPTGQDELLAALAASAALHSSTVGSLTVLERFSRPRSAVPALPPLPANASLAPASATLLQVGALNQFHAHWQPLIQRHHTPSAICGYMSLAYATLIASLPHPLPPTFAALQPLLLDLAVVDPLVEHAMASIAASRRAWVAAHPNDFEPHARGPGSSRAAYQSNWVANYEISDILRALPGHIARHILFLRFNQLPEYAEATHEERARMEEERPFGGLAGRGSKSNPDSYGEGHSMFILEDFGALQEGRALHAPSSPAVAAAATPWRVALVDLDGHFAVAMALQGQLHLINTTQHNYLSGGGALRATAMAHDLLVRRGVGDGDGEAGGAAAAGAAH